MTLAVPGLDQLASVYVRGAGGKYDGAPVKTGLECRLAHLGMTEGIMTGPERREIASTRALMFDPVYVMPEDAQIVVDGITGSDGVTPGRWNVERGSLSYMRGPHGDGIYRRAIVTRAT